MFCERCGTKIEAGENFCPSCGNRVAAPQQQMMGGAPYQQGGIKPSFPGVSALSSNSFNIVFIALGVWMLICTFLPFVSVKLDNAMMEYVYDYLGSFEGIVNYKYNLYDMPNLVKTLGLDYHWLAIVAVILILINIALTAAAGILNRKDLYYASGGLSAFLAVGGLVYFFGIKYYVGKLNATFYEQMGEFAKIVPGSGSIISRVNGAGLVLLIITLIAVAVLAFRKAPNCR